MRRSLRLPGNRQPQAADRLTLAHAVGEGGPPAKQAVGEGERSPGSGATGRQRRRCGDLSWLAAAASGLLAGCATLSAPDLAQVSPEARWLERKAVLEQVDRFELQGRVASSGNLGMKGDLRWQQHADGSFALNLAGPFGAGAVSVAGSPGQVEVRTREGRQFTAEPEAWIRQRLGWTFPIAGLRYWALGLPAPQSASHIELDADGRIAVLEQDGWRLEYDEYLPAGTVSLPRRLRATHAEVTLKLIADRWDHLPFSAPAGETPPSAAPVLP